jgi:hypothetical protein
MASVESSQRATASSAAAPRTQQGWPATRSSSKASVKSSQHAMASLAATPSQRGQPTSHGTVQRVAGHACCGSQAIGGTIDSTLVAAASNITPM